MLPVEHRLRRSTDFSAVTKRGRRTKAPHVVVHTLDRSDVFVRTGGARFGFVVSKAVGNSVVRHGVARKLRAAAEASVATVNPQVDVVVRALPSSAHATTAQLTHAVRAALTGALR